MDIAELHITQASLFGQDPFCQMVDFVRHGGFFTVDAMVPHGLASRRRTWKGRPAVRLIALTRFEDDRLFVHDGHHRAAAILAGGRTFLREDEYFVRPMRYAQYEQVNFAVQYVTPFAPHSEVRLPDFSEFKRRVLDLHDAGRHAEAEAFIRDHRRMYCRPRTRTRVAELIADIVCPASERPV